MSGTGYGGGAEGGLTICLITNDLRICDVLAWLVLLGPVESGVGTWCLWWAGRETVENRNHSHGLKSRLLRGRRKMRGTVMLMQIKGFVDVSARARRLGCRVPVSIALLPGNFSTAARVDEFCFHAATPHVRSAWQSVGLEDEGPLQLDHEEIGPDAPSAQVPLSVFFGSRLLGGQAWRLTVALGMVSSVLAFHPGCATPRENRFDVVVGRRSGGYACLEFRGDACELVALVKYVRGIWAGNGSKPLSGANGLHAPTRP